MALAVGRVVGLHGYVRAREGKSQRMLQVSGTATCRALTAALGLYGFFGAALAL